MLSWSTESLLVDGRSQGEIRQGVTTEIMGEGTSMGPLSDEMKRRWKAKQNDKSTSPGYPGRYWGLEKQGVSPNVASYVGAATMPST
jgi:N-acyl-D-amino-acid deacylase